MPEEVQNKPILAVIGGTGDLGSALAKVWAVAGYPVVIGSRLKGRAEDAARHLAEQTGATVRGDDNRAAAELAGIVVLCVPYANHAAIVEEIGPALSGKILIDAVVPLVPPKVSVVQLPASGSPAVYAQQVLGPGVKVASAFHNVGAKKLQGGEKADCDVLVFGDDPAVREQVIELANVVAARGVHGGVLANSVAAEALTSVLIAINRRYKTLGAGIRITGLPERETGDA